MGYFLYDYWGKLFNCMLIFMYLFYIWLFYPLVMDNFKTHHKNRWNALLSLVSLVALSVMTALSLINSDLFDPILVYPYNYFLCVFWAFWLMVNVVNNSIHSKIKLKLIESPKPAKDDSKSPIPRVEWERKAIHTVSGLASLAFCIAPIMFYWAYTSFYLPTPQYYEPAAFANMFPLGDLSNYRRAAMIHYQGILLVLIAAITAQFDAELFLNRLPGYEFIFKRSFEKTRREEEVGSIGSHIPMILGIVLAIIIITYNAPYADDPRYLNATNAMILPTVFADMAACMFGKLWGKKKWWFTTKKSYVGTFSGCAVTLVFTIPLLGVPLGLISMVIFMLTDLVFPQWNLTDNFMYPMCVAVIYRIAFGWISPYFLTVNILPVALI